MTRTAIYVGGPLDGERVSAVRGQRWCTYRDGEGVQVAAKKGDRLINGPVIADRTIYAQVRRPDGRGGWAVHYLWQADPSSV